MEQAEKRTKDERKAQRKLERLTNEETKMKQSQRMRLIKIAGILAVIIGIFYWWTTARVTIPEAEKQKPINAIQAQDWQLGNPQAPIQVIEYSDFQCPACKIYTGFGELLVSQFGDRVGFAYRHFPLKEIHQTSQLAAYASEAAGKQGKFWEMNSKLFTEQDRWADSSQAEDFFQTYARELELDEAKFSTDLNSKEIKALVEADYLSGLLNKINATPTFYINGQKMNNLRGPDDLIARIELTLIEATRSANQSN